MTIIDSLLLVVYTLALALASGTTIGVVYLVATLMGGS